MKPLKKFSAILEHEDTNMLIESLTNSYGAGILDLVKKLGYSSMDEIAKEKKLLSKLENLLKDLPKKSNISEDDAEEIQDAVLKMGEPRSIEDKASEKVTKDEGEIEEADIAFDDDEEEDEEVGAAGKAVPKEIGDGEKTSDEIEDIGLEIGEPEHEPEAVGDTKVTKDAPITVEVPDEEDDEEAGRDIPIASGDVGEEEAVINDPEDDNPEGYPPPGGLSDDVPDPEEVAAEVPKAARRIKAFEDFIQEDGDGSTSTVIKKVRYSDDATEPEDYGVPIAASADPLAEGVAPKGIKAVKAAQKLYTLVKKALGSQAKPPIVTNIPQHGEEIITDYKGKQIAYSDPEQDSGEYVYDFDADYTDPINYDGDDAAFIKAVKNTLKEGYDGEKRGADDEYKGDEDEDKGDKKVDTESDKEREKHYAGAVASDKKQIDALKKDLDYDEDEEKKAKADESYVRNFSQYVDEEYDKVVWGGDKGDKSKTDTGEEDYEDDEDSDEAFDDVTLGGNKGDKSKTDPGEEDYEDEEEKDETYHDVTLGGNKGDKSKTDPGEEDYEDEEEKDEAYDKVVWGGDKGDKSETDPGKVDYPEDEEEDEKDEAYHEVTLGGNKGDKSKTDPGEEDYEDEEGKDEDCGDHKHPHEEDEEEDSVTEETDEMEAKEETIEDEKEAEESGAAGITIPLTKGDGSESAAGIAAATMERGKPKKEPESLGAGFVSKEEEIEEEPETSPDDVGTKDGGKVVTSVPGSNVSESLKIQILKKFGKNYKEINESLQRIAEKEITSDAEFKEYATEILKKAHGDDYDEAKATEVIDGLKGKYKGDYGAMIGALQSSMG